MYYLSKLTLMPAAWPTLNVRFDNFMTYLPVFQIVSFRSLTKVFVGTSFSRQIATLSFGVF